MDISSDKYVVMPLEVKVRDFNSRLVLSLELCKVGFNVIIGSQDIIQSQIHNLPEAIYFDKSLSRNKLNFFRKIKDLGFIIVSQDEEGLCSLFNYERYITQRVCNETLDLADYIFTWGSSEAELIKNKYPKNSKKVVVTGNPRIDLLRTPLIKSHNPLAEKYRQDYGPYFLFPSSFTVNHAMGSENVNEHLIRMGRVQNKYDLEKYHTKQKFFEKTYSEYVSLVKKVANEFKDINIIVRPHPSEDHFHWNEIAKYQSNIKIISKGDVASWIIGSDLVIHSSCTTGMESFIIDKPVISYLPFTDHEYVKQISNSVSKVCSTKEGVIECIKDYQKKGSFDDYNRKGLIKYLSQHVVNVNGNFSYKLITNYLLKLEIRNKKSFLTLNNTFITKTKREVRKLKDSFLNPKNLKYAKQKFSGLNQFEIESNIERITQLQMTKNNFKVKKLDKNLFLINIQNSNK